MIKLKVILILLVIVILQACSGVKDTSSFSPQEHFDYTMELFADESYEEAIQEFQAIILQYPGSSVNDDAQFFLAQSYFKREQYILAAYEFSKLIKNQPASDFVHQAQFMLAESYYQLSPNYQLDQKYTEQSIREFQAFIDFFPTNPKVPEAETKIDEMNEKLAEKLFRNAALYETMENYNAAIAYFAKVSDTYHDTQYASLALFRKIKLLALKQRKQDAIKEIAVFLNRYPENPNSQEVMKIRDELIGNL